MKKRFIIHIGPHKTGSTYIQKTLFENRSKLKEAGIEYSEILEKTHIGHHDLAEKLYTKKYNVANKILTDIKASEYDILLSSENFDRLNLEDVEFLAQSIKEYQVEIIFFKRRLDDLLVSSWQESIKHGGIESWSKYFFKHLLQPFLSEVLNHSKVVDLYINAFGKDYVKIIDFDNAEEWDDDICDLLFEAINLPELKGLGSKVIINKSMTYSVIEIIRVLNILYRQKNMGTPHHYLRDAFLQFKKEDNNNKIILKLQERIEDSLESISFTETFIFNHLNKSFLQKYKENIINYQSDDNNSTQKVYQLPDETWYMQSEIVEKIELLYQAINETTKLRK